jgi:dTDP-4-amino-4,6-dideoxygalactose transaminase
MHGLCLRGEACTTVVEEEEWKMIAIASPVLEAEERQAVLDVLASGQLAQGSRVAAFERRFAELCQVREAIAVSSGTAALHLALLAHDIGPGDEVITTPFSFAATANAILMVGATPVFVDIEADTFNLDPAQVEAAITPRTKALLPVHLYGHPAAMLQLKSLAATYRLAIIEDACQAHAASINGQMVGSFGTGCFSFYATKNMTTGEGGMITTNDAALAQRLRLLRSHGQQERYRHLTLGYNLRMTEMQAALGLAQLEKLQRFTQQRIANAAVLSAALHEAVQTPSVREGCRHVYHQYTIRVPQKRDEWAARLGARGIGTGIHYPLPIHRQPFYREHPALFRIVGAHDSRLPVAERAAQEVLSLPVHPALNEDDLATITSEVLRLCA